MNDNTHTADSTVTKGTGNAVVTQEAVGSATAIGAAEGITSTDAVGGTSIYERLAKSNALSEVEERAHWVYARRNVPTGPIRSPAFPGWR